MVTHEIFSGPTLTLSLDTLPEGRVADRKQNARTADKGRIQSHLATQLLGLALASHLGMDTNMDMAGGCGRGCGCSGRCWTAFVPLGDARHSICSNWRCFCLCLQPNNDNDDNAIAMAEAENI